MSTTTANYSLVKPAPTDRVDVAVLNGDFDAIDAALGVNGLDITSLGVTPEAEDMSAAVSAAMTTAVSRNKALLLPLGLINIAGDVQIPSGLRMVGCGPGSGFKVMAGSVNEYPLRNGSVGIHDVHLADFEIDGNKSNQSGDPSVNGTPNVLMALLSSTEMPGSNIILERLYGHDSIRLGFVLSNIRGGAIRDCRVENNGRDGISLFDACQRIVIRGNRVLGCNDDHIALDGQNAQISDIVVADNVLTGPGVRSLGKGIRVQAARNVTVTGNVMDSLSEEGIRVNDWAALPVENISITGNTIASSSGRGILVWAGSALYPGGRSTYAHISDVVIADNALSSTGLNAIELRTDHADNELMRVKVRGNIITAAGGDGVVTTTAGSAAVCDVDIDGNTVYGGVGHGVFCNLAKRARVCGNTTYNNGTGGTNTTGVRVITNDLVVCTGNVAYETRSGGSRTQTIGIYIYGQGTATAVLWKDNLAYNMNTGYSAGAIPGLASTDAVFNHTPGVRQPVTGSREGNVALASLMTALDLYGVVINNTTAE